jgi:anti-sigma factor RsiW
MNDADFNELELEALRRPLKADEETALQAYLAAHPEAQADWQTDLALNHVLRRLFDAPLSSNFTAQLLQAVEREERIAARRPPRTRWLRVWSWRWPAQAALAGVVACACLLSYAQYRSVARVRLAESVEAIYGVASLPSDVLENVDAISQAPPEVDVKLLAALQQ